MPSEGACCAINAPACGRSALARRPLAMSYASDHQGAGIGSRSLRYYVRLMISSALKWPECAFTDGCMTLLRCGIIAPTRCEAVARVNKHLKGDARLKSVRTIFECAQRGPARLGTHAGGSVARNTLTHHHGPRSADSNTHKRVIDAGACNYNAWHLTLPPSPLPLCLPQV